MNFRVLFACFLADLLVIFVKAQTTGVCPATSCSSNDTPCKIDGDCKVGNKCCVLDGFKCCKVPLPPVVCSCGMNDTPCQSSATCVSGTSCCLDTSILLRCCRPLATTTTPPTTTAVVQCLVSDTPCYDDVDCSGLKKKCIFDKINKLQCCM